MSDFDVLFVGAGHNALVCAAYLARAGYRVGILERRPVVTEQTFPGYRFDLGGSAHILVHNTPIVRELELERHGLKYIDIAPIFFAPFPDGSRLFVWKDVDRTCRSIAAISPQDAEIYSRFIEDWRPFAQAMIDSFLQAPSPLNLVRTLGIESSVRRDLRRRLQDILGGYGGLLRKTFVSSQLQAVIGWMAAQSGPPATARLGGPFALWHPMHHQSGIRRPLGGSGMLTQALARSVESNRGTIITEAPVSHILVERGRAVVSGAHIHTTLALLGANALRSCTLLAR